ncbi:uncharacterized protein LOC110377937 [Helicoverpa armigera]|uniref:uncharacterized protein LOC110377937 n=1 Tax=Helicoverpa armigera TaxID=29058 RepID=UPI003082D17B
MISPQQHISSSGQTRKSKSKGYLTDKQYGLVSVRIETPNMAHTEELRPLLSKIAEEQNYKNPEIIIKDISSGGANYTSTLHTAIIKAKNKEDLHLFAKIGAVGEKMRSEVNVNFFDTEQYAYLTLFKSYAALEEEHGVAEEHRLPYVKMYGYDNTLYKETLVLEDLTAQGFGSFDRFQPMDWEYAAAAVTECAKLHALSFATSKQRPEEFEKSQEVLKTTWETLKLEHLIEKTMQNALKVINPQHKKSFEKFASQNISKMVEKFYSPINAKIITHGDFRGNNLLHRVREDGKVDIRVVDLQTLQGGSPPADLLYFILTGTDEKFRAKYFDRLVEHYYSQLSAAMRRLHLNPHEVYSKEVFDQELKEKLPYGLALILFLLPIVTIAPDQAPTVDHNLDMSSFTVQNTSDLFSERLNGIINDYVKWGILK